jgi:hypothetical protein
MRKADRRCGQAHDPGREAEAMVMMVVVVWTVRENAGCRRHCQCHNKYFLRVHVLPRLSVFMPGTIVRHQS